MGKEQVGTMLLSKTDMCSTDMKQIRWVEHCVYLEVKGQHLLQQTHLCICTQRSQWDNGKAQLSTCKHLLDSRHVIWRLSKTCELPLVSPSATTLTQIPSGMLMAAKETRHISLTPRQFPWLCPLRCPKRYFLCIHQSLAHFPSIAPRVTRSAGWWVYQGNKLYENNFVLIFYLLIPGCSANKEGRTVPVTVTSM